MIHVFHGEELVPVKPSYKLVPFGICLQTKFDTCVTLGGLLFSMFYENGCSRVNTLVSLRIPSQALVESEPPLGLRVPHPHRFLGLATLRSHRDRFWWSLPVAAAGETLWRPDTHSAQRQRTARGGGFPGLGHVHCGCCQLRLGRRTVAWVGQSARSCLACPGASSPSKDGPT